jgi:hypothetical protein
MGIFALVRSSAFWLSLLASAWLALDPVVKCAFVAVYQHLRSRREGDDLRGLLAGLPREQQKKAELLAATGATGRVSAVSLLVFAMILVGASSAEGVRAAQALKPVGAPVAADAGSQLRVQKLRQALNEESQRAIYRWHDAEHPSPPTWFERMFSKTGQYIGRVWGAIGKLFRKLWPRMNLSPGSAGRSTHSLKSLRFWIVLLAALVLGVGVVLIWRRQRRESVELTVPMTTVKLPDLNDAAVASDRSEEEWFRLADRFEREGELRLAVRSAYLGLLAGLARREWLTIRRDRTNREYLDEFTRRWRRRPQAAVEQRVEIPQKLRGSLRLFDHVWYGSHPLTHAAVRAYQQDQQEILGHV